MSQLITGEFSTRTEAEDAVADLLRVGIPREEIYIEREMPPEELAPALTVASAEMERRTAGLEAGALVGLIFGLMGGLALTTMSEVLHRLVDPTAGVTIPLGFPFSS